MPANRFESVGWITLELLVPLEEVRAVARRHPELTVAASAALGVLLPPRWAESRAPHSR